MSAVNEQIEFLRIIVERLDSAGFRYMLTGSFAMALYAIPRTTRDIDIVLECNAQDGELIADLFKDDCYVDSDSIRQAAAHQSMFNIIHQGWLLKADFIVRKDAPYRKLEFERRKNAEIEGFQVAIVAAEDLILSKLHWAKESESSLQRQDVSEIIKSVQELDWAYLETWASNLGLRDLLQQAKPQ